MKCGPHGNQQKKKTNELRKQKNKKNKKKHAVRLPDDLKSFLLISNGIELKWYTKFNGKKKKIKKKKIFAHIKNINANEM